MFVSWRHVDTSCDKTLGVPKKLLGPRTCRFDIACQRTLVAEMVGSETSR